ncbi:MAG: endonuclease domain-containing protein, partial [Gammaproteobacteria bacterium]|nr:endonuclease domain-containing protein [Gammaproteobacteria bacterium]
ALNSLFPRVENAPCIVAVSVKLVLDHDHLTGHARDYICDSCNTGLGRFRNGVDFLFRAVEFLEKWYGDNRSEHCRLIFSKERIEVVGLGLLKTRICVCRKLRRKRNSKP